MLGDDSDEEEEEEKTIEGEVPIDSAPLRKGKQRRKKSTQTPKELPHVPTFDDVFVHEKKPHSAKFNLPQAFPSDSDISSLTLFMLFFSDSVLSELADNTNAYAISKEAGKAEGSRHWEHTSKDELHEAVIPSPSST